MEELENRIQQFEYVEKLVDFIQSLRYEDLPTEAVEFAQIFIMDTLAVGIAGTTYDATDSALAAAKKWGQGDYRVIGRPGLELPRTSAAFVNGMQIHALEWDALHEPSVVIAMCAPISAFAAEIESGQVSGKQLILATVIAIEIAVFFGGDTTNGPRFFRPAVAGGMGAVVGLSILRGFDREQIVSTLGLAHAQTSGTMQAHWEGSMALPMQIGNTARMAQAVADMVEAGMTGPVDIIAGRFGFFKLFESANDLNGMLQSLGEPFKITEMAHKPFPAGRATQAVLTMIRQLRQEHQFAIEDIERIQVFAPPLSIFLVGRPPSPDMTPSYARLCLRFVAPLMLIDGDIDPRRYTSESFADTTICDLGARLEICPDGNQDKNALGPQTMKIYINDGRTLEAECTDPLGSPANPLSKQQREDKVRRCFVLGQQQTGVQDDAESFIDCCNHLEELSDASALLGMLN